MYGQSLLGVFLLTNYPIKHTRLFIRYISTSMKSKTKGKREKRKCGRKKKNDPMFVRGEESVWSKFG